jgi:hypothetical protein
MEESKMAAPDSTKLQVNFKLSDGTLINVYAGDQAELESLLTTIQDTAPLVQSVSQSLGNFARPATFSAPQQAGAPAAQAPTGEGERVPDRYGNTWVYGIATAPDCANGKMVLKEGISEKTGKPYKGWYDPAAGPRWQGPKIAQEFRAKTIWV